MIERFQSQVERTPNEPAVSFEGVTLTYKELNERANQLSYYLQQEHDVQKNDHVAVKMTRSCDFIVAIISILKLGAVYVPIDPSYPEERIDYILKNAAINLIIDQNFIDQFNDAASGLSCENPSVLISGEDPVYIIYTSGSTGAPKGIVMPNQSMNNLIDYHILEIPDSRKTMQFTSISFDVSFQEIFSALCSGGCLYPISDDTKRHTEKLIDFYQRAANRYYFSSYSLF